jgi:hypothetical protein
MRYESGFGSLTDQKIDRSQNKFEHPILRKVYERALGFLSKEAIQESSFASHYGPEVVQNDTTEVQNLKLHFGEHDSKIASRVFEAIMHEHVELSGWLGPHAETTRTSEYDDFKNGVDMIVEFNEHDSTQHLALGIDVTFGSHTLDKKFERIKHEIDADELARVKYFRAHGYEGALKQLPRIVVGVDIDKVIALAGLWDRKQNNVLGGHVTKDIVSLEIEKQLLTFLKYAKKLNKVSAVRSYEKAYNTIRRMRTVRNGFIDESNRTKMQLIESDHVYAAIIENLKRFERISTSR